MSIDILLLFGCGSNKCHICLLRICREKTLMKFREEFHWSPHVIEPQPHVFFEATKKSSYMILCGSTIAPFKKRFPNNHHNRFRNGWIRPCSQANWKKGRCFQIRLSGRNGSKWQNFYNGKTISSKWTNNIRIKRTEDYDLHWSVVIKKTCYSLSFQPAASCRNMFLWTRH